MERLNTGCIKMIGAVLKMIIFTSMVNRIINTSRNQIRGPCRPRLWPAWSPNLTPCDYFLWGYMKDKVFVPPQPMSLPDLKNRITIYWHKFGMTAVKQIETELGPRRLNNLICSDRKFREYCSVSFKEFNQLLA